MKRKKYTNYTFFCKTCKYHSESSYITTVFLHIWHTSKSLLVTAAILTKDHMNNICSLITLNTTAITNKKIIVMLALPLPTVQHLYFKLSGTIINITSIMWQAFRQSLDTGFIITNPALAAKSTCKYMLRAVVCV